MPGGISNTPTLWPIVTITSLPPRTSGVIGRAKASETSIPSSSITAATVASMPAPIAVPAAWTLTVPPDSRAVSAAAI
jgi:hypothetical protein